MSETERVREIYQKMAPGYDRQLDFADRFLFGEGRAWVCSQASGDVLELGVGTGRNLSFYPPDVRLTAIDLSPAMLEVARRRARELGRAVDLRLGDAERLEFADGSFDSVVITLVLCTVPSPG
ncbi:MAG TPA: class I SAM-dependent methyltransferase, partial [Candidatus Limnocylindria bacterium]